MNKGICWAPFPTPKVVDQTEQLRLRCSKSGEVPVEEIRLVELLAPLSLLSASLGPCRRRFKMGLEENKGLIRRFVEEIPNRGNMAAADELLADGFTVHFPTLPAIQGAENFVEIPAAIRTAFPDLVETIEDLVAEGDRVVERFTIRGTHLGEFMGQPPTGKKVSWTAIVMYRIKDGRIAECWAEPNFLGLVLQTGAASVKRGLLDPA